MVNLGQKNSVIENVKKVLETNTFFVSPLWVKSRPFTRLPTMSAFGVPPQPVAVRSYEDLGVRLLARYRRYATAQPWRSNSR